MRGPPLNILAWTYLEQVRAKQRELAVELGPTGAGDADDTHHGRDADRYTQRRQKNPQRPGAQPARSHSEHVGGQKPAFHVTTLPSRMPIRRGSNAATSRSWVMTTTVVPAV